ncbi:hypothetical protein ANCCAN_03861 [Ancylostoma caninum]|uniref:MADF domain-containing protein n=1 Tax=Ancylostoma caninum TaxID=29170 RepID=A0A368H0A0_ANCCA|nr:hypothetical protein ANCCAN_03861 [Ancylostoma caninum]
MGSVGRRGLLMRPSSAISGYHPGAKLGSHRSAPVLLILDVVALENSHEACVAMFDVSQLGTPAQLPGIVAHPRPLPASIIALLITRIQHHPCIWDHDHEFFGHREQIDSAWRAIAEQTDVQDFVTWSADQ